MDTRIYTKMDEDEYVEHVVNEIIEPDLDEYIKKEDLTTEDIKAEDDTPNENFELENALQKPSSGRQIVFKNGEFILLKENNKYINKPFIMPTRNDLIKNSHLIEDIEQQRDIVFMPNDIKENLKDDYSLSIFGISQYGEKILVDVVGIPVDFYILVDKYILSLKSNDYFNIDYIKQSDPNIEKYIKLATSTFHEINSSDTIKTKQFKTEIIKQIEMTNTDFLEQNIKDICKTYCKTSNDLLALIANFDEREKERYSYGIKQIQRVIGTEEFQLFVSSSDCDEEIYHVEPHYGKLARFYEHELVLYLHVFCTSYKSKDGKTISATTARKRAIKICNGESINTMNNDISSYYRKAARENNLSLTTFNVISNYKYIKLDKCYEKCTGCTRCNDLLIKHKFIVNHKDYKQANCEFIDKTIVLSWDIETQTNRANAPIPDGQYVEDNIFMVCCGIHNKDNKEAMYKYAICTINAEPDERWDTIICLNFPDLIKCFAIMYRKFAPDIITGFNDSDYDWKFLLYKANYLGILPFVINTMNYTIDESLDRNAAIVERINQVLYKNNIKHEDYIECLNTNSLISKKLPMLTDEESGLLFDEYYDIRDLVEKYNIDTGKFSYFVRMSKNVSEEDKIRLKSFRPFKRKSIFNKSLNMELKKYFCIQIDKKIKITATDNFTATYLKPEGCVSIDTRVCFKKLYTREDAGNKSSLNGYLKLEEMDLKADLPIQTMFIYYNKTIAHNDIKYIEMQLNNEFLPESREYLDRIYQNRVISNYCIHDAIRCHELLIKRNVYNENRILSNMSYASFNDSYTIANGAKVRNLLTKNAFDKNIQMNLITKEGNKEGKYPGAFVLRPIKGRSPDPNLEYLIKEFKDKLTAIDNTNDDVLRKQLMINLIEEYELANEIDMTNINNIKLLAVNKFIDKYSYLFSHSRPVAGMDFSSLYPSLMMAYNLSPEYILINKPNNSIDQQLAKILEVEPNLKYKKYSFMFGGEEIHGCAISHNNDPKRMGLYPSILINLFNQRKELKKHLKHFEEMKEIINKSISLFKSSNISESEVLIQIKSNFEEIITKNTEKMTNPALIKRQRGKTIEEELDYVKKLIDDAKTSIKVCNEVISMNSTQTLNQILIYAEVSYNAQDAKQKALKVFMNTFYGEAGNNKSPLFLLEHAGGVTTLGQQNIKMIKFFVESQKYVIKYGDTDSLYISPPNDVYREVDIDYLMNDIDKCEYWTTMVNISMRELNNLGKKINATLKADNGTDYLKMAYEEVLFPVVFTGKKKYFGKAHVNIVNFDIEEININALKDIMNKIFIRGIDVIKMNVSILAREIGVEIMKRCLTITNEKSVYDNTIDVIQEAMLKKYDYSQFSISATYKPDKQNKKVLVFIERMKARGLKLPDIGERFNYVIVNHDYFANYTIAGNRNDVSIGEKMEYLKYANENNIPIDKSYYFNNSVVGICARFINHDTRYINDKVKEFIKKHTNSEGEMTEEYQKELDDMVQKIAKDDLNNIVSSLTAHKYSAEEAAQFKVVYKECLNILYNDIVSAFGKNNYLDGEILDFSIFCNRKTKLMNTLIKKMTEEMKVEKLTLDITNISVLIKDIIVNHRKTHKMTKLDNMTMIRFTSEMNNLLKYIQPICIRMNEILEINNNSHRIDNTAPYERFISNDIEIIEKYKKLIKSMLIE